MASLSDGELRTRIAFHIAAGENLEEAQALVRLGGSFSNKRFRDIYHEMKKDRPAKPVPVPPPVDRDALVERLHVILLKSASVGYADLARMMRVDVADVLIAVNGLVEKGYNIVSDHLSVELQNTIVPSPTRVIDMSKWKFKHHIYGLTGDNHLGSKYSRLDVLNALFDIWKEEGVETVYQCGNIIDGEARFNVHDLLVKGIGGQTDYLIDNWPQRTGMETCFVTGDDHEGWYVQREGIDIGRHIQFEAESQGRHDLKYLGHMEHTMDLRVGDGRSIMRLIHGGGGTAYAISYKSQKIVESYQGSEKPNILCIGHFHKFDHSYPREVTAIQVGCFTGNTSVLTPMGRTPIRKMKTGDEVICADGKARKVVRVFRRMSGQMRVRINYGRKGRPDQSVVATEEHPILIERSGIRCWMAAKNVKAGDLVFTQTTTCRACGTKIPWWGKMCVSCNPVDDPAVREKIAISRGGSKERTRGGSDGDTHMQRDILPLCRELQEMGWKVVPVGAGVIPDAIGFKDGKVVAIESERSRGALLEFKQNKYVGSPIMEFIDEVLWVPVSTRKAQPRTDYAIDPEMGLAKVRVISVTEIVPKRRKREVVYNLDVEEDHTYIAGGIAVHNCTEDQTPFMRKKEIAAHVGGVTLEFDQDDHGIIHNVKVAWHPFFDKGFYSSDAWKYHFKNPNLK
jgi:Holliday junction resolvase